MLTQAFPKLYFLYVHPSDDGAVAIHKIRGFLTGRYALDYTDHIDSSLWSLTFDAWEMAERRAAGDSLSTLAETTQRELLSRVRILPTLKESTGRPQASCCITEQRFEMSGLESNFSRPKFWINAAYLMLVLFCKIRRW